MKNKILDLIKQSEDYISGEEIGRSLGISRAAVWKNIERLREKGYKIESVSNRGYKLVDNSDVLNCNDINYDKFLHLEEVDSTNEECKRQANKGCASGFLVSADRQTAGKGRLGRSWSSYKNEGLFMSMVLRPDIMPAEASQITLIAGIAVRRVIEKIADFTPLIKWPNDIIINGRKLVGILTEMNAEIEKVNYIVLGIGINVNTESFEDELSEKATSLYIETGKRFKRSDIINCFLNEFKPCYELFVSKGFEPFIDEYNAYCANVNKEVKTVGGRNEIRGTAKGVNNKGELLILSNGELKPVFAGEVSVRLNNNKYI